MRRNSNETKKQIDNFFEEYYEKRELVKLFNTLIDVSFDEDDDIYTVSDKSNKCLGAGKIGEALRFYVVENNYSFEVKFKCAKEGIPFSVRHLIHYKQSAKKNRELFHNNRFETGTEDELYIRMISEKRNTVTEGFIPNINHTIILKYNLIFYYFHNYYPKRYGNDIDSNRIRLFKMHDIDAMNYYYDLLRNAFPEGCRVCSVPPSEKGKESALMTVLRSLDKKGHIEYCPCLERRESCKKKAYGGERNIDLERKTISYDFGYNLLDKNVILIDDVCTTGVSLAASRNILLMHNVASVECLVLGATIGKEYA